jgi:hypothetical protein
MGRVVVGWWDRIWREAAATGDGRMSLEVEPLDAPARPLRGCSPVRTRTLVRATRRSVIHLNAVLGVGAENGPRAATVGLAQLGELRGEFFLVRARPPSPGPTARLLSCERDGKVPTRRGSTASDHRSRSRQITLCRRLLGLEGLRNDCAWRRSCKWSGAWKPLPHVRHSDQSHHQESALPVPRR